MGRTCGGPAYAARRVVRVVTTCWRTRRFIERKTAIAAINAVPASTAIIHGGVLGGGAAAAGTPSAQTGCPSRSILRPLKVTIGRFMGPFVSSTARSLVMELHSTRAG